MDAYDSETLAIGVMGRPHGVKGEISFRPHDPGSVALASLRTLLLVHPDGRRQTYQVAGLRPVAGGYLVRLVGVNDREAAAALTLAVVQVERSALPPLGPGEYYVEDVTGCAVQGEDGRPLGVVRATFWNGAHDVCSVVDEAGRERLIPLVPDFVLNVDVPGRSMRVRWEDDD